MLKRKYIYIALLVVAFLVVIAFAFPQLFGNEGLGRKIIDDVIEVNHADEIRDVLTKFDSIYADQHVQSKSVGSAVVVVYKGQIALIRCSGVKKAGEIDSVDIHTVFRLASVSKTVSGVLAGILAEEKIVNLDDTVANFIPGFRLKNQENTQNLTVRHLLSHSSGLAPHSFDMMVEQHATLPQIIEHLPDADISAPPGKEYAYQNVVFSLYGQVVQSKTSKSFQSVIKEKVFDPFGMKDASSDFESFSANLNKAFPHQRGKSSYKPLKLNDRYYVTAPAAGVNASISDMAHFLMAISSKDDDLFSESARSITFKPEIESPLKHSYYRSWGPLGTKHYALGWRIVHFKNRTVAQHSGYVSGYQAEIAVCHEEEIGIALITNSPNSYFSSSIPMFLGLLFEKKDKEKLVLNPPASKIRN